MRNVMIVCVLVLVVCVAVQCVLTGLQIHDVVTSGKSVDVFLRSHWFYSASILSNGMLIAIFGWQLRHSQGLR